LAKIGDITCMSPPITAEQLAALPPEMRAVVEALIDRYERRIAALEAELAATKQELAATKQDATQLPTETVLGIDESPTKEGRHRNRSRTFLEVEGVEPTNNASERALRPAVIWRKLSFGTKSAAGSRFVETILTVVETCHRQSRNTFDYLTAALKAHFANQPVPPLLHGV
jgi:hypothetical protein